MGIFALAVFATVARADAVDDTLAKFLDDKFPQTAVAIGELSAEAPPQAAAILEALGDNRLMINPADHVVAYKTSAGALLNARTGQPIPDSSATAFKKVRVNNALRSAIQGAMGSLTLANPDPEKRLAAAEDVFRTHDDKALPALQTQLGKESDAPLDDLIDIGVVDGNGDAIAVERKRLTSEESTFTMTVDKRPAKAGIDPLNKLIDRKPDDNLIRVEKQH